MLEGLTKEEKSIIVSSLQYSVFDVQPFDIQFPFY